MSKSALKDAFEKALELPQEGQAAAAGLLEDLVAQYKSGLRLSSQQVQEIRRRQAEPNPEYATEEEVDAFFRRGLHED